MPTLLTREDLQVRWQLGARTIDKYREDGIITPVKGLPCIRYNEDHIRLIEECIPERTTRREKSLEKQLQEVTDERNCLRKILANINVELIKAYKNEKE